MHPAALPLISQSTPLVTSAVLIDQYNKFDTPAPWWRPCWCRTQRSCRTANIPDISVKYRYIFWVAIEHCPLSSLSCATNTASINSFRCRRNVLGSKNELGDLVLLGWLKMPDVKLQDMKMTDQIAGHENAGHEFAIHDKYRMKIYYITVQCAFFFKF